jgi:hypothetical protein
MLQLAKLQQNKSLCVPLQYAVAECLEEEVDKAISGDLDLEWSDVSLVTYK